MFGFEITHCKAIQIDKALNCNPLHCGGGNIDQTYGVFKKRMIRFIHCQRQNKVQNKIHELSPIKNRTLRLSLRQLGIFQGH